MSLTTVQPGMLGTPQPYNFKNRLINGAMVINQWNNGAAVVGSNAGNFCVDRWRLGGSFSSGRFTIQQNLNSLTPPSGFTKYSGVTTTTAESPPSAGALYLFVQWIEGVNVADLGWGTANAQTVTLSFWARSSLTGTFAGDVTNGAQDRSFVFTYSLPVANTWTFCTVTIPGPTTGTWPTDTSASIGVRYSLGTGSTYLTSSTNQWLTGQYEGATGQTNVVSTNGATWYLAGAQLEVGVTATTFDYRPYTLEQQLCYRYYQSLWFENAIAYRPSDAGTGAAQSNLPYLVSLRTTPSVAFPSYQYGGSLGSPSAATGGTYGVATNSVRVTSSNNGSAGGVWQFSCNMTLSAEL